MASSGATRHVVFKMVPMFQKNLLLFIFGVEFFGNGGWFETPVPITKLYGVKSPESHVIGTATTN
jgi:hypothetical protein